MWNNYKSDVYDTLYGNILKTDVCLKVLFKYWRVTHDSAVSMPMAVCLCICVCVAETLKWAIQLYRVLYVMYNLRALNTEICHIQRFTWSLDAYST